MRLEILDEVEWADAIAAALAEQLRANPGLRLCLPTGSTPGPFYSALAGLVARSEASFRDAHVFLLDEYLGLPPGHRARCDVTLRRQLLDRVDLPADRFHAIDVDAADAELAATRYEAEIAAAGDLDLALLGLGANGHVGMNEPGSRATDPARVVKLAPGTREASLGYGADTPPEHGITAGLSTLLAAREVGLLVRGEHKAAILARALTGPVDDEVPATHLRAHDALTVYADRAAAAALPDGFGAG